LDVEGSEPAALTGLAEFLVRPDAPPILYESNGHTLRLRGETCRSLKSLIERFGYRSYLADQVSLRLVPISAVDPQPDCFVDCLAVKAGPHAPAGWAVTDAFSPADWLDRFRTVCRRDTHRDLVGHIIRELAEGPDWIRADPVVRAFLANQRAA
jgi:hypothetical protein